MAKITKLTKSECGRIGGKVTLAKYGREYFSNIGKVGAAHRWESFDLGDFLLLGSIVLMSGMFDDDGDDGGKK